VQSQENLRLMGLIDRRYTDCPFYGSRRMTAWLNDDLGESVNRKRVVRLMRLMGLEAIYPKPKLSAAAQGHQALGYRTPQEVYREGRPSRDPDKG